MRRLILLRHAKTEKDSTSGKDQDRCLDERGESDATEIGAWLAANGYLPDIALVSTAARTRQTWDRISLYMPHCRVKYLDDLYLAETSQLLTTVQAAKGEPASLLVLGHNPGLHEFAWNLTGKSSAADRRALGENLPTAAAAIIEFAAAKWSDVADHAGTLKVFVSPKRLREASDFGG